MRPIHVQGSRLIQRNIRAKAVTLRAFSGLFVLASPTRPVGPGYYIWRLRRSMQLSDQVSQICSYLWERAGVMG